MENHIKDRKGGFFLGFVLILLSFASLLGKLFYAIDYLEIGIFIFGIMGGVELGGRYVGYIVNKAVDGK